MEQRDYLMRQVEQFGEVLRKLFSKLLNFKESGVEAVYTVNQYFADDIGIDITRLCEIDDDELIDTLQNTMHFGRGELDKLADLLWLVAEKDLANDRGRLLLKCLVIHQYLAFLEKSEKTYSFERNLKIEKLELLINLTVD